MLAGVINQDAAHGGRGNGEEVRASAPLHARLFDQSEIGFVNQVGSGERVAGLLALQMAMGNRRAGLVLPIFTAICRWGY